MLENSVALQPYPLAASTGAEDNALSDVQRSERSVTPLWRKPIMRALGLQHVAVEGPGPLVSSLGHVAGRW